MRVLVCGSRTYTDFVTIDRVLDQLHEATPIRELADGMATGADTLAYTWATKRGISGRRRWRADWETHGRAAGPIRNAQMLAEFRPDLVVAFIDKPLSESRGTEDMVLRAMDVGVPVHVFGPGASFLHHEPTAATPEPEPLGDVAELTLF